MHTAQEVLNALRNPAVAFTQDQIREAWDLLKTRHNQNQALTARSFKPGDTVEFDARGEVQRGVVEKINQKSVSVKVGFMKWKVGPSLLRHAPKEN